MGCALSPSREQCKTEYIDYSLYSVHEKNEEKNKTKQSILRKVRGTKDKPTDHGTYHTKRVHVWTGEVSIVTGEIHHEASRRGPHINPYHTG